MGFLHYLDVMIGYALGMAILATLIGTATGTWLAAWRTRSRYMNSAVTTALRNIDGMTREASQSLAASVLNDGVIKARAPWKLLPDPMDWPLVGGLVRFVRGFASETIHREELALLVLRKAAGGDPHALTAANLPVPAGATAQGVAQQCLRQVEQAILKAEVDDPSLPAQLWRTQALQQHASGLASQLFTHYDNLMDRVEDNVRASGKLVSVVAAAVFLYFAPVDSLAMLARLSGDANLRQQVLEAAVEVNAATPAAPVAPTPRPVGGEPAQKTQAQLATGESPVPPATPPPPDVQQRLAQANQKLERAKISLEKSGLFGDVEWPAQWPPGELKRPRFRPGVLITWAMVSMGAPFWLGLLNKLLGLRSVLAQRSGEQRALRDQDLRQAPARAK